MPHNLEDINKWIGDKEGSLCDPEVLSELRSIVLRSVYEKKLNELRLLREWLNPIAASIARQFQEKGIQTPLLQAAEIPVLASMLRSVMLRVEKEDLIQALRFIRHGKTILSILLNQQRAFISFEQIIHLWPSPALPSTATISRTLAALEQADFISRKGATKGRHYELRPNAYALQNIIKGKDMTHLPSSVD